MVEDSISQEELLHDYASKTKKLDPNKHISIGVHDGRMHADEVCAVAALKLWLSDVEVVRTRDEEMLKTCDMRIDVGGKYNPETLDFDHHQMSFFFRHAAPKGKTLVDGHKLSWMYGPKRSGFGLIWFHYGLEILKFAIAEDASADVIEELREFNYIDLWQQIDNSFVAAVDAIDNGEKKEFFMNASPYYIPSTIEIIGQMNPAPSTVAQLSQSEIKALEFNRFTDAVEFASQVFRRYILRQAEDLWYFGKFTRLLSQMDPNDHILVMEPYIPWNTAYNKSGNATNSVYMVVYPTTSGEGRWCCQSPRYDYYRDQHQFSETMSDGSKRTLKFPAPMDIRGLSAAELQKKTGIPDARFVHAGGWLAGADSKEGAIKLAQYIIKNPQK